MGTEQTQDGLSELDDLPEPDHLRDSRLGRRTGEERRSVQDRRQKQKELDFPDRRVSDRRDPIDRRVYDRRLEDIF